MTVGAFFLSALRALEVKSGRGVAGLPGLLSGLVRGLWLRITRRLHFWLTSSGFDSEID
jgi:hypothetical protein